MGAGGLTKLRRGHKREHQSRINREEVSGGSGGPEQMWGKSQAGAVVAANQGAGAQFEHQDSLGQKTKCERRGAQFDWAKTTRAGEEGSTIIILQKRQFNNKNN
eukprot:2304716-Pyramimonas_sp.AAC.1